MVVMQSARFRSALRWVTLAVVVVNSALAYTGVLGVAQAVYITLACEAFIALIVAFFLKEGVRSFRQARGQGLGYAAAFSSFFAEVLPGPVLKLARHELALLKLVGMMVRRQTNVPEGAVSFRYGSEQRSIFFALIAASLVEIVVVELLVPWKNVRIIILVLSVYAVIWLLMFYKSYAINPHYLYGRDLVLRVGVIGEVTIPLGSIESIRSVRKTWDTGFLSVTSGAAVILFGTDTNIEIVLREPIAELVPGKPDPVSRVYCAVDKPQDFVAACKAQLDEG